MLYALTLESKRNIKKIVRMLCIKCVYTYTKLIFPTTQFLNRMKMKKPKRVQVTFSPSQWELIEEFRGKLGNTDSEIIRNIVLSWLAEKSIISTIVKKNMGEKR